MKFNLALKILYSLGLEQHAALSRIDAPVPAPPNGHVPATPWYGGRRMKFNAAFKILYSSGLEQHAALSRIDAELTGPHIAHRPRVSRASERGICRARHGTVAEE